MSLRNPFHQAAIGVFFTLATLGCGNEHADSPPYSPATQETAADATTGVNNTTSDDADIGDISDSSPDAPDSEQAMFNTPAEAFDAVNPFIGSGGVGYNYAALTPAAQLPLGLVRLGPDTTDAGFHPSQLHHFSGYYFDDPHIRGFSHTHFIGTGVADFGNIRVLPMKSNDLEESEPGQWYANHDRTREDAEPGFYTTHLPDAGVGVELTSGRFTGFHRYTFEEADDNVLTIDLTSSVVDRGVQNAELSLNGEMLEGWVSYRGPYSGRTQAMTIYVSAKIDPAPTSTWVWNSEGLQQALTLAEGQNIGAVLQFENADVVSMTFGFSLIDIDQARTNREDEALPFEEARARSRSQWTELLSQVELAGGDSEAQTIFFTALYNAYRMPTRLDEVGGRYRGIDGDVHATEGEAYYTDLSLWDTFRTLHPWYTLAQPTVQRDCLLSLLAMSSQGGKMPRWPAGLSYTKGMIGRSADVLFGESAVKGIRGVDFADAAERLIAEAIPSTNEDDPMGFDYDLYGYIPEDLHDQAVSETLERAYHDWALSNLAAEVNHSEAETLRRRSNSYANLYSDNIARFVPRDREGNLDESGYPLRFYDRDGPYTEGTSWHWRFYVPHDPAGLVALMGEASFNTELETFFERSIFKDRNPSSRAIPDPYYWHANEPALHTAYLFARVGDLERTAYWVRAIQRSVYDTTPSGLAGNDDGGTLSAWYLFSALGFFPIAGGDEYVLSPPVFSRARLHLDNGNTISIEAPNASPDAWRINGVTVDGEPLEGNIINHATLRAGPTLRFEMSE